VKKPCSATDPLWYKDAIIYELHVRAFADSNADGIGDFQGLISKLDYLQDLGVTCLWLLPFFPSPLRDDGYDIADYTSVNPSYGTIEDFQQFLDEAHSRNLQVMIELVINHTSDQHPWFRRARQAPKGSPERDFYVWSDNNQLFKDARIIFTDTEKSNWAWDEVAGQYYWHRFFSHQPDLNFDNPVVLDEVIKAMRFWLDMGVDAMRMDAIPYLVERDGTNCENLPETHVAIKKIRAAIDAEYSNRLVLAEANQWPADVRPYFGDGDECHMAFHFPLMPRIYMALRQEDRLPITDIMAQTPPIPDNCQWGLFLRNHDELTLEMVTDDERDYMYLAYSSDPRMRINVGIRRRLAPLVDNNRRRIELLNSLLLSFPGTPIMYYGDEIGMGDNIYLGDRNGVRTPMQWNSDRNAGFSTAVPARLYFPVILDPVWGYQAINVEAQQGDPSSLLHWTRNMIALRKLFQVFGRGSLEFLNPVNNKVLAYIRCGEFEDGHSETVLCVANLSRFAQPVALDMARFAGRQPVEMLGYVPFPTVTDQPYPLTLAPYSFLWLELQQGTGAVVSAEVAPEAANDVVGPTEDVAPQSSIEELLAGDARNQLEQALPSYMAQQRWFGDKTREISSARIASATAIPESSAMVLVVEVKFADRGGALYQLPLAAATSKEMSAIEANSPQAVVTTLVDGEAAQILLYDASFDPHFRTALLHAILESTQDMEAIAAARSTALDTADFKALPSHISSGEQSNTSLIYGDKAILKLFRKLSAGENPDVEIGRFLADVAHFDHVPRYLGDLHRASDGTTLAFLQAFAPNEGDAWTWTLKQVAEFYQTVANTAAADDSQPSIPYRDAAGLLGKRTAELHLALATPTQDAAFAAEAYTADDLHADRERIRELAEQSLAALENALGSLPLESAEQGKKLIARREELMIRVSALAGEPALFGQRIRIHGDYHLGQVLRTSDDFFIVDFEGEPARTLDERRRKQSPLKDVAGMLRSFSYAAQSALAKGQTATMEGWARAWETGASNAFLQAYQATMSAKAELLPQPEQAKTMLRALLVEKALYELLYELNNRPDWVHLPMSGIMNLLDAE